MMSSSYDKPSRAFRNCVADLRKAFKRRTVFLRCDEGCNCGGEYHALRGFRDVPRSILQKLNPIHFLDHLLGLEARLIQGQLSPEQQRGQQLYESFLWDRRFLNAGICTTCGRGRLEYGPPWDYGTCQQCQYRHTMGHGR